MNKSQNANKKTLDTLHLNKIKEFHNRDSVIAKLQKEIEVLEKQVNSYKSKDLSDTEFDTYMNLKDNLLEVKKKLSSYEKHDDEIDYYINTAPILFQYYDILENGKDVNTIPKTIATSKSILKYFLNQDPIEISDSNYVPQIDRATLLDNYMHVTDSNYIKAVESTVDKCPYCEGCDRNIMLNDGMIYCNDCNTIEYIIVDHERPSYKDPPKEMISLMNVSVRNSIILLVFIISVYY